MYFRTVRGDTRRPSLSRSSLAIRSCPHVGFSQAIRRIRACRSAGSGGRPDCDFRRQNRRNPWRGHRVKVCGCTMRKACRQSHQRESQTIAIRVAVIARRGLILRSSYRPYSTEAAIRPNRDFRSQWTTRDAKLAIGMSHRITVDLRPPFMDDDPTHSITLRERGLWSPLHSPRMYALAPRRRPRFEPGAQGQDVQILPLNLRRAPHQLLRIVPHMDVAPGQRIRSAREPVLRAPDQGGMDWMEGDFNAEVPVQQSKTEIVPGLRRAY
jgi:hypothetical protein